MVFSRYEMHNSKNATAHFHILVASANDSINPLTDCCALVPYDPFNEFLTDEERIVWARKAIHALLKGMKPRPSKPTFMDWKTTMKESGMLFFTLQPGQPIRYDPSEWKTEPGHADSVVRIFTMFHAPTKLTLQLSIDAGKDPESIDPFEDCCVVWEKPDFLQRSFSPSDETVKEMCGAAIAVHLDSLGAWPPKARSSSQHAITFRV
jgi:hypothetical protein